MTRRRGYLALLITVLAVACVAPFWREAWLKGYELDEDDGFFSPVVYRKKIDWWPGPEVLGINHVCYPCRKMDHDSCSRGWFRLDSGKYLSLRLSSLSSGTIILDDNIAEVRCTCPVCFPDRGGGGA